MPFRLVPRRDRKLNRLAKSGEELTLGRGEGVYRPGDPARDVYLVRSGHVEVWLGATDAASRVVALAGPLELFGLEAASSGPGVRRRYGARAGEGSILTVLPGKGVEQAFRTGVRTFPSALRALDGDLWRARWAGPGSAAPTTPQRVADVLLDLTGRFGREEAGPGTLLELRLTHRVLADLAGAHRSTVTTLLNDWIYRGVVRDTGRGLVIRTERLADFSSRHRS